MYIAKPGFSTGHTTRLLAMLTCYRFNLCSLLILSIHVLVGADVCSDYVYNTCNHAYLKMEEALINQKKMLNKLRAGFLISSSVQIDFYLNLEVVNGSDESHDLDICGNCWGDNGAFCFSNKSEYNWTLCGPPLALQYRSEAANELKLEQSELDVDQFIQWMSYLHTSFWSIFIPFFFWDGNDDYFDSGFHTYFITLRIDRLDYNPCPQMLKCVLSQLLSWIKAYSEVGGRPQTWDQNQKGTVTFNDDDYDFYDDYNVDDHAMQFMNVPLSTHAAVNLCLAEYVFVSLSLALVIAKFFPAIHNQIVSKATTSLQYQSLYWGTAVVSNVFVYGLLLTAARGWSISITALPIIVSVSSIQEVVVHVILLVGALIGSLRSCHGTPIPTGMAKIIINISFCFSCFCFYVCCTRHCRTKTLRILILFSFMCFIYHGVMECISVGFLLFIETSRAFVVTVTTLSISLIVFLVVFVSYIIFLMSSGRNVVFYRQGLSCFGGACMLTAVFGAVILLVVMYMVIFFSLKLTGVRGIVTGLIPSIALSAASWYIKKRLQKADQSNVADNVPPSPITQSEYGATDARPMNDGGRENSDSDAEKIPLLP